MKPGEYLLWVVLYHRESGRHNLAKRRIKVLELRADPLPGQRTGLVGLKDRVTMLRTGLAPTFTIEDMIAEGDKVVVRWRNNGSMVGEFLGMPANGKSFSIPGIDIYRLENGKLAEHWHVVDALGQAQQIGLIPSGADA